MRTFWHSLLIALKITLVIVLVISIVGIGVLSWYFYDATFADTPSDNALFQFIESLVPQRETQPPQLLELPTVEPTTEPPTEPPTTLPPEPEHVVSTATIGTVGDLLMHKPVFDSCQRSDGSYDFESIFRYIKGNISSLDYAIANLETTFGGDNYKYQGNPAFNCPDALADSVVEAGFDMLLTANNHAGDTMGPGIIRTVEHVRGSGLATLGTQFSGEPRYSIVDINGIRVGMVCYTWSYSGDGVNFSLNGLSPVKDEGQVNYFTNKNPDKLYNEAQQIMTEMKNQGAEATMMFIHWGVEYVMTENVLQDTIAQRLCDMGFDVIVGGHPHVVQPMEHVRGSGLATLGTQFSGEPRYSIVDINGIRVGMVCYTWSYSGDGVNFSLNGLSPVKDEGQVNYFTNKNPDKLYNEAQQIMTEMKNQGAEATMMFIHWGVEYVMTENVLQDTIAQRLCDMGFDVIVGGHPHVVQPMDLLTSTVDPDHKTVVIYSLGNAVSNQRTGISDLFPRGYTEDGVLFNVTFCKYSDGTVYLQNVDVIPTWVDLRTTNGRYYHILPLDGSLKDQWQSLLDLSEYGIGAANRSYDRTMGIVGEGLALAKQYLADAQELRDANYLAAVYDAFYAA